MSYTDMQWNPYSKTWNHPRRQPPPTPQPEVPFRALGGILVVCFLAGLAGTVFGALNFGQIQYRDIHHYHCYKK